MNIIGITDVHGRTDKLHTMAPLLGSADLIILSGDITHFGGGEDAENVLNAVRGYNSTILAVPGNCDTQDAVDYLSEQRINLDGTCQRMGAYTFIGLGGSLPTPGGNTPIERSEEMLASLLHDSVHDVEPGASLVLVSHQPPADAACDIAGGMHVGSKAVRTFIETYRPLVCFTGHIHESTCIDSIGSTKLVNPGPLQHGYCASVNLNGRKLEVNILHADGSVSRD
jgi:Icc-related predicted phosphoesterase